MGRQFNELPRGPGAGFSGYSGVASLNEDLIRSVSNVRNDYVEGYIDCLH